MIPVQVRQFENYTPYAWAVFPFLVPVFLTRIKGNLTPVSCMCVGSAQDNCLYDGSSHDCSFLHTPGLIPSPSIWSVVTVNVF